LAAFFYRTLKPGVRPLDHNPNALLSPADGRVLQFGAIESGEVEQVKGMTYSLDALLGMSNEDDSPPLSHPIRLNSKKGAHPHGASHKEGDEDIIKQDEEFATVNGITYTLPNLFSGPPHKQSHKTSDASTTPTSASEAEVRADLARGERPWYSRLTSEHRSALY
jgi:phosphatidylserine decarboxylase